jgi:hypothetical protein
MAQQPQNSIAQTLPLLFNEDKLDSLSNIM